MLIRAGSQRENKCSIYLSGGRQGYAFGRGCRPLREHLPLVNEVLGVILLQLGRTIDCVLFFHFFGFKKNLQKYP
jgi:hypothetical protein